MDAIVLLGISGAIILGFGVFLLHHVNKTHSIKYRTLAVILSGFGGVFLWASAAYSTPPVIAKDAEVASTASNFIITKVTYNPVRNCTIKHFSGVLIFGNNRIEVPAMYITSGYAEEENDLITTEKFSYVAVVNVTNFSPDSFYLQVTHECPFGFTFQSNFPILKIPKEFNEHNGPVPPIPSEHLGIKENS